MPFGLCDKNGTASCGYKSQSEEVSLRYEDCLSATTAGFYKGNVEL